MISNSKLYISDKIDVIIYLSLHSISSIIQNLIVTKHDHFLWLKKLKNCHDLVVFKQGKPPIILSLQDLERSLKNRIRKCQTI